MAASNHLNKEQLRMFLRPDEVVNLVDSSVDQQEDYLTGYKQTVDDLWKDKREELDKFVTYSRLVPSIKKHGIQRPITIVPPDEYDISKEFVMGEGHHRVMAAKALEEETGKEVYIPVVYSRHWDETSDPEYTPEPFDDEYYSYKPPYGQ